MLKKLIPYKYFWAVIKHKWFVFIIGRYFGVPIHRRILHDWSKFLPQNLWVYNTQFYCGGSNKFDFIWLKHQNLHDHHWEYWVPRTCHSSRMTKIEPLKMSHSATMEMLADWFAASRSYNGKWPDENNWPWWDRNFNSIQLHKETKELLNYAKKSFYARNNARTTG